MVDQYCGFAHLYDRLMEDVDYEDWANYVEKVMAQNRNKPHKILEIACGTGNVTIPLAKKGYNILGLDISKDMLMIAKNKALENNINILFIEQDMIDLELEEKFDCILSMCDGINYIVDINDLMKVFQGVYNALEDGGVFIFDISSHYKIKNILGNNTFGENLEDLCYLWENYFDEGSNTIEMDLTFFIQDGKYYRKEEEYHVQRAYKVEEIIKILNQLDFKDIKEYDGFTFNPPKDNSERIFFVAKK
ncbi:class I SAM-dependent methyltransferase [Alkaliphilus sp. MSJ-5]|uniref:Class I SAM-dependent methyltransferase n=1 Tax=Alkaliphilus flagellatus TaxID=2841507 RepID=A0ABS6G3S6_9FIRM|nr:class I SAM-dependent methyltransferase [Alkaliphilus flagellatus]MBU5677028.1 class I SAM-dependent methyltransferase [Alkaliphilus flagellatus]